MMFGLIFTTSVNFLVRFKKKLHNIGLLMDFLIPIFHKYHRRLKCFQMDTIYIYNNGFISQALVDFNSIFQNLLDSTPSTLTFDL